MSARRAATHCAELGLELGHALRLIRRSGDWRLDRLDLGLLQRRVGSSELGLDPEQVGRRRLDVHLPRAKSTAQLGLDRLQGRLAPRRLGLQLRSMGLAELLDRGGRLLAKRRELCGVR